MNYFFLIFFFIVFQFTERALAMVLIILIRPAHIEDRNSGETSGLREPSRFLIIGAQHGAGLFRLLGGEHWMKRLYPCCMEHMYFECYCCNFSVTFTQPKNRSGQLQRYEEELHHLEQELTGIKMVPGRIYDMRNRTVPRIVSNLSTSSSQSTWAQVLPQPQNNLSSAGRITRQERVKTPVNTTQDGGCGTDWRSSLIGLTERKEITETIRVAGRRCGVLTVASCKATSHGQKGNILPGRGQWWGNGTRGQFSLRWL